MAARIFAIASESRDASERTSNARSAPIARPVRNCSMHSSPPILTTAMSISPRAASRRNASSSAIASNGLTLNFTPSVSMPDPSGLSRILVSESGTRFHGTRIFISGAEFEDAGAAHPAAHAHRDEPITPAAAFELAEDRDGQFGARRPERMAQSD